MTTSALRNLMEDNVVMLPDRDDLEEIRVLTEKTLAKILGLKKRGERNRVRIQKITEVGHGIGD